MSSARAHRVVVAVLAMLAVLAPAFAAGDDDALERRMLEVASGLRCPVCQNLSVADSTAEMAREMRGLILDELRAGKSPTEIRAYFVEKYGEWILLSPTPRGFALLVWLLPVVASVAGFAIAGVALVRWTRRPRAAASLVVDGARVTEALAELEFDHRAGKLSTADYEQLRALYEARAEEARTSGRARAERRIAELEARAAALLRDEPPAAHPSRRRPGG